MNIYGIGTDIVNVNRIKSAIKKNNHAFKKRVYTNLEIKTCERRTNKVECFAKRFAAKEAFFKAVGLSNKLQFNEIEIKNNSSGAPKIVLKGPSLKNLKKIFKNKKYKIHLSLSDDKPWAVASVIIFTYK
tara:strand:+ start:1294 stop:1683 length:390 start_codon:yes stop_codon:yes gene_type:complete